MLKFIFLGGILHLFFLLSIFVIYFQSPVLTGLQPQNKIENPPAKRLVLFVADGLRAESFFREGCAHTKFLQNVILSKGIHGISHTRVPTESRPGHVALIAGLYEDPSALFKGWQENPVDFDSVFNRSKITYAWGSPDILRIFENKSNNKRNIKSFSYDPSDEDFSGRRSTILLDTWVFDNVENFLKSHHKRLEAEDETIFFLHLLGLDTAGHVHKPNTKLFKDNLLAVDRGVERITNLINDLFRDDKTAFIFTADHGMTDRGSHGDGDGYETETPILAWGAGISEWTQLNESSRSMVSKVDSVYVPRFDIKQADVAPLMASLLGIPVPVNNLGQLPYEYLNTSQTYVARAIFNNALQITEQYKHLRAEFAKGEFAKYLNDFESFDGNRMEATKIEIDNLLNKENYSEVIQMSKYLIGQSLNGIEYFQSYYQHWLLAATALSMIGWILFLLQTQQSSGANKSCFDFKMNKFQRYFGTFGVLIILAFMYFQNLSIFHAIVFCGPFLCWLPISWSCISTLVKELNAWIFVLVVEFLTLTFFHRSLLCIHLVALPVFYVITTNNRKLFCTKYAKWISTSILLSAFPLFPVVGRNDKNSTEILIFGIILWSMKFCYSLQQNYSTHLLCNFLMCTVASMSLLIVELSTGLNIICQVLSWTCLILSFMLPLLQSSKNRFARIIDGLCIPFLMLSLSYEPIFLLLFSLNLEYFLEMQSKEGNRGKLINSQERQQARSYTEAYSFMLYLLLSFFGTGNLASISSFDPNSVRCFVAVFSPFVMTGLIILKIVIPLILVVCAFTAIYASYKLPMDTLFVTILVLCNVMGINFLFFVTNKGSWLEIGTSISHFVIIEATTIVLCALQLVAKFLMESKISLQLLRRRVSAYKFE